MPPDLTSPTRDDRYAVPDTGGKGTATFSAYAAERSPQARRSSRATSCRRSTTRASNAREPALAGRQRFARQALGNGQGVLAGDRLSHQARVARCRRDGNRLGREPRQDSAGFHPQHSRQGHRLGLFDRRAGQVPHPSRTRQHARNDRYLHQPSRHVRDLRLRRQGSDQVATAPGRSRTGSRDAAPPDDSPGQRGEARHAAIQAARKNPSSAPSCRAATTVPARWRSRSPSIAPGGESVWRLIASASPSKTGIAPRACISFATSIPKRRREEGGRFLLQAESLQGQACRQAQIQYRIFVRRRATGRRSRCSRPRVASISPKPRRRSSICSTIS
jgi:hypothetical protein